MLRELDHIEIELKEIRKHLLNYPKDVETATEWLERLRLFIIETRLRYEDDHR